MRFSDQFSLTVSSMHRHPGRTAMTAIGLLVSSSALLLLAGLAMGTQGATQRQFSDLAELRHVVVLSNSTNTITLNRTAMREIARLPGVQSVVPRQDGHFLQTIRVGKYSAFGFFYGIGVDDLAELGYAAEAGSTRLREGSVVVNQEFLEAFWSLSPSFRPYRADELIGVRFEVKMSRQNSEGELMHRISRWTIDGVLNAAGGIQQDPMIFLRLRDIEALNDWVADKSVDENKSGYTNLIVLAEDVSLVKPLTEHLAARGYVSQANLSMAEGVSSTYALIHIVLGGQGITALLVAIFTLANTMATLVVERTREIGLMKTLGASQIDILRLFLGEAIGIGVVGSACGVLIGGLVGLAADRFGRAFLIAHGAPASLSIYLPPWLFLGTVIVIGLVAALTGLSPALRAAQLPAIVALRQRM